MKKESALAVLAACCIAMPGAAFAASEADCAAQWKSADGNGDGVLVGPEAERYLAYYRVRAQVTPTMGASIRRPSCRPARATCSWPRRPSPARH